MITDANSLADIEFRDDLENRYAATHMDNYSARRLNFRRDCFPQRRSDPAYAVRGLKR